MMGEKKESLWTVPFVLDTVINLLVFLIYYLLMVIIAVVAKDELHASASEAGLAVGIILSVLLRLVSLPAALSAL